MTIKNLYFRKTQNAEAIMAGLGQLATSLGFSNQRGDGDITGLLEAIADGDLLVVSKKQLGGFASAAEDADLTADQLIDAIAAGAAAFWLYGDDARIWHMIGHLETMSEDDDDAFASLAAALRYAAERAAARDADIPMRSYEEILRDSGLTFQEPKS